MRAVQILHIKTTFINDTARNNEPPRNTMALNETDSNAMTSVAGTNFLVLQYTTRMADVYSYDLNQAPKKNIPIVTAATAYDCPRLHTTYILVFNEILYYGTALDHSLINPNQVRHYGIGYWDNPFDPDHGLQIDICDDIVIPLQRQGTVIGFETRVPTDNELNTCEHIYMTSAQPWDPQQVQLKSVETEPELPNVQQLDDKTYAYLDPTSDETLLHTIDPTLTNLKELMIQKVRVASIGDGSDVPSRRTFVSTDRHMKVTEDILCERFGISPARARATLKVTTQRGTRSAILPLSRRYRADRRYKVKTLDSKFAMDTFFSTVKSITNNTCSQIYSHQSGFTTIYHMNGMSGQKIGDTLKDFIHKWGVPEKLIFDGHRSQVGPNTPFMQTIKEYAIEHHVSEPNRPNQNPA